ncbi:Serine/threonine-protein kinase wnk3 [Phlyctochytrium planicorne]|nr:Serine/threonine-protein kinase wnk3 [Phlyctochytrium planicorne]
MLQSQHRDYVKPDSAGLMQSGFADPKPIPAAAMEDDDDDDEENRVVETDPTGRFQRFNKSLGKGAYKEVFKAFDDEEGVEVAWNRLRVDHLRKQDAQRILSEIRILQSLRNDNIINLFAAWSSPSGVDGRERVIFITELMTSGTLKSYLRRSKGPLKPKVLKSWCRQVLSGLHYLHSRTPPIIHRDLKCENIFINGNNGTAKIGDLGLAVVKSKDHVSSVLGTPEFMAPELYDEKYDEKVDIYAFGMVVIEIVTKEYPYSECSNQAQIYKKVTSGIKPLALQRISDEETLKFIEACVAFDPTKRPSAGELLQHPFLKIPLNPINSTISNNSGGAGSSTHSLDTVTSESSQLSSNQSPPDSMLYLNNQSHLSQQRANGTSSSSPNLMPLESDPSQQDIFRRSTSQTFPRRSSDMHGNHERERMVSEASSGSVAVQSAGISGPADGLRKGSEDAMRTHPEPHANPSFHSNSLPRNFAARPVDPDLKCKVSIELIEKQSDTIFVLKILYTASGAVASATGPRPSSQREISFPFNIVEDTTTDVVAEMVRESLVKEEDEAFVRRRLEEATKEFFFSIKPPSGSNPNLNQLDTTQKVNQDWTPANSVSSGASFTTAIENTRDVDNMSPNLRMKIDVVPVKTVPVEHHAHTERHFNVSAPQARPMAGPPPLIQSYAHINRKPSVSTDPDGFGMMEGTLGGLSSQDTTYRRGVSGSSAASERSAVSDAFSVASSATTSVTSHSNPHMIHTLTPPLHGSSLGAHSSHGAAGGWVNAGGVSPQPQWYATPESAGGKPVRIPSALSNQTGNPVPGHLASLPQLNLPKAYSPPLDRARVQGPSMSPPSSQSFTASGSPVLKPNVVQQPQSDSGVLSSATASTPTSRSTTPAPPVPGTGTGAAVAQDVGQKLLEMQVKNINLISSGNKPVEIPRNVPISLLQQQQLQQPIPPAAGQFGAVKPPPVNAATLPPPMVPTKSMAATWQAAGHERSRSVSATSSGDDILQFSGVGGVSVGGQPLQKAAQMSPLMNTPGSAGPVPGQGLPK